MDSWPRLRTGACSNFFLIGIRLWAFGKKHGFITQIQFFRARFESDSIGYLLFPILVLLVIPYLLIGILEPVKHRTGNRGCVSRPIHQPHSTTVAGRCTTLAHRFGGFFGGSRYVFMGGSRGAFCQYFPNYCVYDYGLSCLYILITLLGVSIMQERYRSN